MVALDFRSTLSINAFKLDDFSIFQIVKLAIFYVVFLCFLNYFLGTAFHMGMKIKTLTRLAHVTVSAVPDGIADPAGALDCATASSGDGDRCHIPID
jgi:hypothetical protein